MQLDINTLINERCNYPMRVPDALDPMIDYILADFPNKCFLMTSEGIFERYYKKSKNIKQYYVAAIFDMSTVFQPTTNLRMSIYVLSKDKPVFFKTGRYLGEISSMKGNRSYNKKQGPLVPVNPLSPEFIKYCNLIEKWINNESEVPVGSYFYDFNIVDYHKFDIDRPYANRYTKKYFEIINGFNKEKVEILGNIAEIISPKIVAYCHDGFTLSQQCMGYPFKNIELKDGRKTTTKIKKGDIIINRFGQSYVIIDDVEDVYINTDMFVIRNVNVLPKYLYIYFNSEIGRVICDAYSRGSSFKFLSKKDITDLPIVIPTEQEPYEKAFQTMQASVESLNRTMCILGEYPLNIQGMVNDEVDVEKTQTKEKPLGAYEGPEKYIFISYAHKDFELVSPIMRKLQDEGYKIWYDDGIEPGNEWDEAIAEHIQKATIMLAFISDNYIKSENCKDELNFARDENIERILIYLEDTELPAGIKMRLGRQQAIHYFRYSKKEEFYEKLFKVAELKKIKDCVFENDSKLPEKDTVQQTKTNTVGKKVLHKVFGIGMIKKIYGNNVLIEFEQGVEKLFLSEAFGEYITLVDDEF